MGTPALSVGTGKKPWTPNLREKAMAVLGEVPGQGLVYRQNHEVNSESNFIREQARSMGMTLLELSDRSGVSYSYLTQVAKDRKQMGIKVQASIKSVLGTRARVAPAKLANRQGDVIDGEGSSYIRERARAVGMTLKELAERGRGVPELHVPGGTRPPAHGGEAPGQSGGGAQGPDQGRGRPVPRP